MDKKEIDKIIDYLSIKGCFSSYFKGYAKMYAMTTENISGFINKYDLKNKKVLTVAGSGDQRYNCYLNGAKDVVCFDNNPLAELHIKLKDTAMKELEYADFLKFFGVGVDGKSNCFLDKIIFNKFKNYLDEDVYLFYDFLINGFRRHPFGDAYYDYYNIYSKIKRLNDYVERSNFDKLSNIMTNKDINFLNVNVFSLPEVLVGERFDMILLSNISDYIHYVYPNDYMAKYRELIDKLVDNLYDGGIIQIGYIYSRYRKGGDDSNFHIDESRNKLFPVDEYPIEFVNSIYNDGTYDKIITYHKK